MSFGADSQKDRLWRGIQVWMEALEQVPGWMDWKRNHVGRTMVLDPTPEDRAGSSDFEFPPEIARQHKIVMRYLDLVITTRSLKDCEHYFRNYPFRRQQVSRRDHLANICEMYFSRFYEFRERLKTLLKAFAPRKSPLQDVVPTLFKQHFGQEINARNAVHHEGGYDDDDLSTLSIYELMSKGSVGEDAWTYLQRRKYRGLTKQWADRVLKRAETIDAFMEVVAGLILLKCDFLVPSNTAAASVPGASLSSEPAHAPSPATNP